MTSNFAKRSQAFAQTLMASCLAIMAMAVFLNVVLRYGFGSGIAASEELSRLLFVWLVFIGATSAYPLGEHMAFTSLVANLRGSPEALRVLTLILRGLVILSCALLAHGAWHQVQVGFGSHSVVLGYPNWLLPLPVLLSALAIGVMAFYELLTSKPLDLGPGLEVE